MSITKRLRYYQRIFPAYLNLGKSQLTFWHDFPQQNPHAPIDQLGEYYMEFPQKAGYTGHLDGDGIPLLDYRGHIGLQYNPIAIAQWGLGNYNLFREGGDGKNKNKFLAASDWLHTHLCQNSYGVCVWLHHFDWEYRETLKAPWYSGLAQGQGISLLLRAHLETRDTKYIDSAQRAFASFLKPVSEGGVVFVDQTGHKWIEEYIVTPPTHILNGFIWAAWGVRDYFLATGDQAAKELFAQLTRTLLKNLPRYDLGYWSLYEQSGTTLPMVASRFYHQLHIIQLDIMHRLTGEKLFADYAERWREYAKHKSNRSRAACYKGLFKLCYY